MDTYAYIQAHTLTLISYIQPFENLGEIGSKYLEIDEVMTHAFCLIDGLAGPSARSSKTPKKRHT